MIKYGKREYLEQIVAGKIRFAPSQTYIKIEEMQNNKGQGDLLEGKMKIKFERAQLFHPETGDLLCTIYNQTLLMSIQDVNNMPVFCLSHYDNSVTTNYINEKNTQSFLTKKNLMEYKGIFLKQTLH